MLINGDVETEALSKIELEHKNERLHNYLNAMRDKTGSVGNIGKLFQRFGRDKASIEDGEEENMRYDSSDYKRLVKNSRLGKYGFKSNRF